MNNIVQLTIILFNIYLLNGKESFTIDKDSYVDNKYTNIVSHKRNKTGGC